MKKKIKEKMYDKYPWPKEMPEGLGEAIDFLPPPHELVLKEKTSKVTLSLGDHSLAFFKKHAKAQKVPYQKMIRVLLDEYVRRAEYK